jgi:translocation and assembly module TamB
MEKRKRSWWKIIVVGLGALIVLLVVIALMLPFWLPLALRPGLGRYGVQFGKYERLGYSRFVLHDLRTSSEKFDLSVTRAEGFLPYAWYSQAKKTGTNTPPTFLQVNGWKVVLKRAEKGKTSSTRDVYPLFKKAESQLALARKWLPKAVLLNGIIQVQEKNYSITTITWDRGKLDADGSWPENQVPMELKGNLTGNAPYQLSYAMNPLDLRFRLQLFETNNGLGSKAMAFWKGNRADINAQFGRTGMIPETADLKASNLELPGEALKLRDYERVTGNVNASWKSNRYNVKASARAEPSSSSARQLPAIDLNLAAEGDTNQVNIQQLTAESPGLNLALQGPVEVSLKGELLSSNAQAKVSADLGTLPMTKAQGHVDANITANPSGTKIPRLLVSATSHDLVTKKIRAEEATVSAELLWPIVTNVTADVRFATNSVLHLNGAADLEERKLFGVDLKLTGNLPPGLLATNITFTDLAMEAHASGSVTQLTHSAKISVNQLQVPQLAALNLDAQWSGQMLKFDDLRVRAQAGPANLLIEGTGESTESATNLVIKQLTLKKGDEEYLSLAKPFAISLLSPTNGTASMPEVKIEPLVWTGTNRVLMLGADVLWPQRAGVQFAATNINPDLFQFFVQRSLGGVDLPHLSADLDWNGDTVLGSVTGEFSIEHGTFKRVSARVGMNLTTNEVEISELALSNAEGEVLNAQGILPITLHPLSKTNRVDIREKDKIEFTAKSSPNTNFWDTIAGLRKVRLIDPAVALQIKGTPERPRGTIDLTAESLQLRQTNRELPKVEKIRTSLSLNEQRLRIKEFSFLAEGQPFRASGEVELGQDFWSKPREQIRKYVMDHADLRMQATNLAIAPFVRFFPKYAAPEGSANIDVEVKPGRQLAGGIMLSNLSTRPISKVGTIEKINAAVAFNGRAAEIKTVNALIGGERLDIAGTMDFSEEKMVSGLPAIRLTIKGNNIPLARNPDVILRADLNLIVSNEKTNPPVVAGVVNLRDSFLMRDISTLTQEHVTKPSRRPPYFSIETEPVAEWRLNVRVRGVEFMRVSSPFFQGTVSANFKVQGTLKEPVALGEATIPSGLILFPFANLEVKQGLISLTSDNPYMPTIFFTAGARTFGYDISMEASGSATEPVVKFSSIPALTSEEIVLMLTTGELPRKDFAFSTEQRAGQLAMFVGKSLWSKYKGGQGGAERLTINTGEDISEQGKQTYRVEYKLTNRWSLVGEYDRFGDINAGVKWKLYSR